LLVAEIVMSIIKVGEKKQSNKQDAEQTKPPCKSYPMILLCHLKCNNNAEIIYGSLIVKNFIAQKN
jgi:hypothetical protein